MCVYVQLPAALAAALLLVIFVMSQHGEQHMRPAVCVCVCVNIVRPMGGGGDVWERTSNCRRPWPPRFLGSSSSRPSSESSTCDLRCVCV